MSETQQPGSDTAHVAIDPLVFERRWKILAVLCTSLMVVIVGNTALNVALPTLARELDASISAQQWMVDAYSLVFAGLLLTAGTIGDRYGRKIALISSNLLFGVFTFAAAYSTNLEQLFWLRLLAGLGIGGVIPNIVAIATESAPRKYKATLALIAVGFVPIGGAIPGVVAMNGEWNDAPASPYPMRATRIGASAGGVIEGGE